jgi:16S rRNA A1518/A1519 N6-dimethyltransferase RsmA/KsgA/DIM1 with predicted DNA glycosylase/AP lyase activity
MIDILEKAQNNYDFFETPNKYAYNIYDDCNSISIKLDVIDICCGLGSLVQPWYDNGHNITLVELNPNFIPILKEKYPNIKMSVKHVQHETPKSPKTTNMKKDEKPKIETLKEKQLKSN